MYDESIKNNSKEALNLAKKVVIDFLKSTPDNITNNSIILEADEISILSSATKFIHDEVGVKIEIYTADQVGVYDPQNRSKRAVPGKPAIYLE